MPCAPREEETIGYTLDNWPRPTVYTTHGRLPIDNNAVERSIRPVAPISTCGTKPPTC